MYADLLPCADHFEGSCDVHAKLGVNVLQLINIAQSPDFCRRAAIQAAVARAGQQDELHAASQDCGDQERPSDHFMYLMRRWRTWFACTLATTQERRMI